MNDVEQDALSRALKTLAADAPAVPGLAQRARRGHRRLQAVRGGAVAAGALVLAGAGLSALPAAWDRAQPQTRPVTFGPGLVASSAITRGLSFDAGTLKVTPAAGAPAVDQARAVSLFRSTGPLAQLVQDVSIGYGEVTLKTALASGWHGRPAWVVVYRGGPHGCPYMRGTPARGTEGRHVFVLDSTSGTDALSYQESGPRCGTASGPTVQVAQQYVSLPWTQEGRTTDSLTVRYRDQDCTGGPVLLTALGTADRPQVEVVAERPMTSGRCAPGAEHTDKVELLSGAGEPEHAPTGPVTGVYTSLQPNQFVTQAIQS